MVLQSPGTNNMNIDNNVKLMYTSQWQLKYLFPIYRMMNMFIYVHVIRLMWNKAEGFLPKCGTDQILLLKMSFMKFWTKYTFTSNKSRETIAMKQTFSFFLLLIIRSSPLKAPDATNKMFVVSTCTVSPLSFLVFFSGTFTIVPSRSLSNPYQNKAQ